MAKFIRTNSISQAWLTCVKKIMQEGHEVTDERGSLTKELQNVILENREKLTISGVLDVLSFDDQIVIVETELGLLTVKGENLRINKLSLDTTEIIVEGTISNLAYSEKTLDKKAGGSFIGKIFK